MSKKDDGGPAFPVVGAPGSPEDYPGMSLRDYFAIRASEEDIRTYLFRSMHERTAARYAFADAMIAQRKEQ